MITQVSNAVSVAELDALVSSADRAGIANMVGGTVFNKDGSHAHVFVDMRHENDHEFHFTANSYDELLPRLHAFMDGLQEAI